MLSPAPGAIKLSKRVKLAHCGDKPPSIAALADAWYGLLINASAKESKPTNYDRDWET